MIFIDYYLIIIILLSLYINIDMTSNISNTSKKENIVLLGDGFFARGFLHHINYKKFFITQIYRDDFINPQDLMYSLQRNIKYTEAFHIRDFITKGADKKIKMDVKNLEIIKKDSETYNQIHINNQYIYNYDYLVIGLGSQKSLNTWKNQFNELVDLKNKSVGIVGMGPSGVELAMILSQFNKIHMFDMFTQDKVLNFLSPKNKNYILELINQKNIKTTFGKPFNGFEYQFDNLLFCGGSKPTEIQINNINNIKGFYKGYDWGLNPFLQLSSFKNIYMGGDYINRDFPKTAQVAYQQGAYVAKRLNGDIPNDEVFNYKHNGSSINIGNKKVLIEGHNIIPDGVYPDFMIKLYSVFCI